MSAMTARACRDAWPISCSPLPTRHRPHGTGSDFGSSAGSSSEEKGSIELAQREGTDHGRSSDLAVQAEGRSRARIRTSAMSRRCSMPDNIGRIALIEDDSIMGESLQRALELEGWSTSWWQTGKEAIDGMRTGDPDLVLCDIRLPDMSGEEIFRAANSHSSAPPFIFMTAYGQIDQAVSLVRAGAHDYLTKPFELPPLFQKAREILSARLQRSAEGVLGISPADETHRSSPAADCCALVACALHWRDRLGKGSVRTISASGFACGRRSLHGRELRGDPRGAPRKRSVRT